MLAVLLAIHATYCKAGDKQECFDKRYTSFCNYFRFFNLYMELSLPVRAASADWEKMVKTWSVVVAVAVKVVMVAARTGLVIFSPLTGFPQQF